MVIVIPMSVEWFSAVKYMINGILLSLLSDELLVLMRRWSDNYDLRRRGYLTRHIRGNRVLRAGFVCRKDLSFPWWILAIVAAVLVGAELAVEFGAGAQSVTITRSMPANVTDKNYEPPSTGDLQPLKDRDHHMSNLLYNCSDFSNSEMRTKAFMYRPHPPNNENSQNNDTFVIYCEGDFLPAKEFGKDVTFYLPFRFNMLDYKNFMNETFREVVKNVRFTHFLTNELSNFDFTPYNLRLENIKYTGLTGLNQAQRLVETTLVADEKKLGRCFLWINVDSAIDRMVNVQVGACIFNGDGDWRLLSTGFYSDPTTWVAKGRTLYSVHTQLIFGFQPLMSYRAGNGQFDERLLLFAGMEGTARSPPARSIDMRIMSVVLHETPVIVHKDFVYSDDIQVGENVVRPTLTFWAIGLLVGESIIIMLAILLLVVYREKRWGDLRQMDYLTYCWWAESHGEKADPAGLVQYAVPGLVEDSVGLRVTAVAAHEVYSCTPPNSGSNIRPRVPRRGAGKTVRNDLSKDDERFEDNL